MCEGFECTHQQYGICNYDDKECEGEKCPFYKECQHCIYSCCGCGEEENKMEIDNLICELIEEPVAQGHNNIIFTSRSMELIHKIAERCNDIPIVQDTEAQAKEYAKDLSAEQVYLDMLVKIVNAPTAIHMKMSVKMLMPIISRKLKEREL